MGFFKLKDGEIAFMTSLKKITILQVRGFYHTYVKGNEGYSNVRVNNQIYHLRPAHIAQLLGAPDFGEETYFDNVQLEHLWMEFLSVRSMIEPWWISKRPSL